MSLTLITSLWGWYFYYLPSFYRWVNSESEVRILVQGQTSTKPWRWEVRSASRAWTLINSLCILCKYLSYIYFLIHKPFQADFCSVKAWNCNQISNVRKRFLLDILLYFPWFHRMNISGNKYQTPRKQFLCFTSKKALKHLHYKF